MKAFFFFAALPLLLFAGGVAAQAGKASPKAAGKVAARGASAGDPIVSSPWVELRKAPLFTSESISLAKIWGPSLPLGTSFHVEKVYGRWVFGQASPALPIPKALLAPPGWVFSRNLLVHGDADTLTPALVKWTRSLVFHSRIAAHKLDLKNALDPFDFYEGLTLSQKTLAAFSRPEETGAFSAHKLPALTFFSEARAEEDPAPMGLTGADLSFLDSEIKVIQEQKRKEFYRQDSKKLKIPLPPAIDNSIRRGILGRYMLDRYLNFPPVTLEEIDGFIYMRATALRALSGCPKEIQKYWKTRHWNFFRIFQLKSRPEQRHPWFEIALPGGYFALSARAIEAAHSEAELAYLLVRQLVRELRVERNPITFNSKNWPSSLPSKAEEIWDTVLKAQSTKDSETFDVADEIAVDMQAVQCLANSGYQPLAAQAYLKKMSANREQPWAEWFTKHSIGLDYRIERVLALTQDDLAKQKYPNSADAQQKRFASATKQWNLLP